MSIKSVGTLIDWTKNVHGNLALCLERAASSGLDERARQLLEYLAGHEQRLAKIIAEFEAQAEPNALRTLVPDHGEHIPLEAGQLCDKPWGSMTFDQISEEVFAIHNQVIELYRYLIGRAAIPGELKLLQALLDVEEHETRQMAQQANRGRDM
jgi:hypothetical protein